MLAAGMASCCGNSKSLAARLRASSDRIGESAGAVRSGAPLRLGREEQAPVDAIAFAPAVPNEIAPATEHDHEEMDNA
jgi:hypothetical protein